MSDRLPVCPHPDCAHVNRPDSVVCVECGRWLIEPHHLNDRELQAVLDDWYRLDRPKRVVDPERLEREADEWDRRREAEEAARSEMWERRRERWERFKRGDTGRASQPIPPKGKRTT